MLCSGDLKFNLFKSELLNNILTNKIFDFEKEQKMQVVFHKAREFVKMLFFNGSLWTILSCDVDDIVLIDQRTLWVLYLYIVVGNSRTMSWKQYIVLLSKFNVNMLFQTLQNILNK